jgi:hypothetical protein
MKACYDSEADALQIDVADVDRSDYVEEVYDSICLVDIAGGKPVGVELLGPRGQLHLLRQAAERFDLDLAGLEAAAGAALAAPDRVVTVSERLPDSSGRVPAR